MTLFFLFTASCIAAVIYLFWLLKSSDQVTADRLRAEERR